MQPIFPILFFSLFGNIGLMLSLTFGALILLRPLTNRLLRSRQRVLLWGLGWWMSMVFASCYQLLSLLPLHFTFRAFLSTRSGTSGIFIPEFLPVYSGPGRYNLSLPGNTVVPVMLNDTVIHAAILVYLAGIIGVFLWTHSRKKRLRALEAGAEELPLEDFGLEAPDSLWGRYHVRVFLCSGLPTSYVRLTHPWGLITDNSVYLQRELPPERRTLVLRHELKHLELYHIYWKSAAHPCLYLFWWSPVVWLAFRLMCRDMELACDEAVMDGLDAAGRRDYARTLAELGAGRPLWESAACFGECDAVLRVRRAAEYRKAVPWQKVLSWASLVLLFVFFFCGSPAGDGTLEADRLLELEREPVVTVRRGILAPDGDTYPTTGEPLRLTQLWRDPDSGYYYGLDAGGAWWRVAFSWSEQEREYLGIVFELSGAPDVLGLEQIK